MISSDTLKLWKEAANAATPGPWTINTPEWNHVSGSHNALIHTMTPKGKFGSSRVIGSLHMHDHWSDAAFADERGNNSWPLPMEENAEFIALSREAVPQLIAEVERLQCKNAEICSQYLNHTETYTAEVIKLDAEIARLREALKFYRDGGNGRATWISAIAVDGGRIARAALAESEGIISTDANAIRNPHAKTE